MWMKRTPLVAHTRDPGTPLVTRVLKDWNPQSVRWVEPPLVFVFGAMLYSLTPPLGFYLMAAAVGLFTCLSVQTVYTRQKLLDAHDASIEARLDAERLRNAQGR